MIIWINGTFGSGKTTTAYELQKRVANSFVYDPEKFGFVLMANVPKEISKIDFQDYPLWREVNFTLLKQVVEDYEGTLIVPMTLTDEHYFEEIVGRLRADGIEVNHFTLMATEATIQKRLKSRLEGKNSWAHNQMEKRLSSLAKETFKEHIQTDGMSIDEIVTWIAMQVGIELLPDHRTKFKKSLDRTIIKIKEKMIFN